MTFPVILTDIEGTTSSISFVKDVLFPYAYRELPAFLNTNAHVPDVAHWITQVGNEINNHELDAIIATLLSWIEEDKKHTALKALQGMIWEHGYRNGDFKAQMYPDAVAQLKQWHMNGHRLAVYSSGSVAAQKLLFEFSDAGNLLPLFSHFFDTAVGHKRDADSYRSITTQLEVAPQNIVFLSDVTEELDAAKAAGLQGYLVDRPQDYPQPRDQHLYPYPRVTSFTDIILP